MSAAEQTLDPDATIVSDDGGAKGESVAELVKGAQMGRYVILRTLGSGAMGTVYLAFDPELDRKVALKLLRGGTDADKRLALLREAQAMARLTHPNVVSVYDAGEHEGTVYVAMELVEGITLRTWMRDGPRPWRDVLDKFLLAGRGLQAAHTQELIHRDFKPDNVMVSAQGQVRVMDFGLARPKQTSTGDPEAVGLSASSLLTEATVGRIAGTPAYMAPEQAQAVRLSPAVDQFAFCVSLWEGVCGERPFDGLSAAEMIGNATAGNIRAPPARARMPRWLRRALQRGLDPAASRRWPSMAELLASLERGRRRWQWQLGVVGLLALAVPVGFVVAQRNRRALEHEEAIAACEREGAAIDEVYNAAARQRLRDGLLATRLGFAASSVDTIVPWLDDYGQAWRAGRTRACRHGTVERDWEAEQVDRAVWCFEDRRLQLEATIEQIAGTGAAGARRAVRLASYLDPVEACLDPNLLDRLPAPPVRMRDEVAAIRRLMSESDKLRHAGAAADALEIATRARDRAEALTWPPLIASTSFLEGRCMMEAGRVREADAALTDAYFGAMDAGSNEVAFRAARSLMRVQVTLQRYRQAEVWGRHAEFAAADKPDPGMLDAAEGHYMLADVRVGLGDYAAAAKQAQAAFDLRARVLGERHPITAAVMRKLGLIYLATDRPEQALPLFKEAYEIWKDAVGRTHPYAGQLAMFRGAALTKMGRPDAALPWLSEAAEVFDVAYEPDHPNVAIGLVEQGRVYAALGRIDEAKRVVTRALAIRRDTLGDRHSNVADAMLDLADIDRRRGEHDTALERCRLAEQTLRGSLEPDHPDIATAAEAAARVHLDAGQPGRAVGRLREAVAHRERARGREARQLIVPLVELGDAQRLVDDPDGARLSYTRALSIAEGENGEGDVAAVRSLVALAGLELASHDPGEARRLARRAVDIAVAHGLGPHVAADAHFALARALAATGAPDPDGRRAAETAREGYVRMHDVAGRDRVDAWLARETPPT